MSQIHSENIALLESTIRALTVSGKGILAADESVPTIQKRLESVGVESTESNRIAYRDMLFGTEGLEKYISGIILFEETFGQNNLKGVPFKDFLEKKGILPGIKVDKGLIPITNFAEDKATEGLDGLSARLLNYRNHGARFAKWRAVFAISDATPSKVAIKTNAALLARYASLCHENGIVPIVEPEILIDGTHNIEKCYEISNAVLHGVFHSLHEYKVQLEFIILKPSMVTDGLKCPAKSSDNLIASYTLRSLKYNVPAVVPSINFLSGGQTPEEATSRLNAMNVLARQQHPWYLSFSYARALQGPALKAWSGQSTNVQLARSELYKRARLNSAAALGKYSKDMDSK